MRNPWIVLARAIRDGRGVRLTAEEVDILGSVLYINEMAKASAEECTCDLLDAAERAVTACTFCCGVQAPSIEDAAEKEWVSHHYRCVSCGMECYESTVRGLMPFPICDGCRATNQMK